MPKALEIVFQNHAFVAVNKPALCLSVRPRFIERDDRPILWDLLENQLGKKVFGIHRLDYEVSGLMIWALTNEAQKIANSWFEKKRVQKQYLAITSAPEGFDAEKIIGEKQLWKSLLLRGKKRAYEHKLGKSALTEACLIKKSELGLCWKLNPITGRSHQLRFELFKRDLPILGDQLYGSPSSYPEGIALQSESIKFMDSKAQEDWGLPTQLAVSKSSQLFSLTAEDC